MKNTSSTLLALISGIRISVFLLIASPISAQVVATGLTVNNGEVFYAGDGLTVSTTGSDSLIIKGAVVVEDSLVVNNSKQSRVNGKLVLSGTSALKVDANGLEVDTLQIASSDDQAKLSKNITVKSRLRFTSGNLYLNGQKLVLGSGSGILTDAGYTTPVPLVTDKGGEVVVKDLSDSIYLPIGYSKQYLNAIAFKNTGSSDTFSVSVQQNVFDAGTSGNIISSDVVQASWMVRDSANAAYNIKAYLQWNAMQEATSFSTANAGIASYENSSWNLDPATLVNASGRKLSKAGLTNIDNLILAVGDGQSDLISNLQFALKVFLQGPYNTVNSNMSNNLTGSLPTRADHNSAYGKAPYSYTGSESFATAPTNAVDWVLVELRDAASAASASSSTTKETVAGLLMKDGNIKGPDGTSNVSFSTTNLSNNAYVVIKHRNHLDIMSNTAITQTSGVYTYDFTTAANKAYGTNAQVQLKTGVYGLYAGDVNADGVVKYTGANNDRVVVFNAINGNSSLLNTILGYSYSDVDLSGSAKYTGSGNDPVLIFNLINGNSSLLNTISSQVP